MRTFVRSLEKKRATISIKHSYVKVFLNGVPVISSANWWSSDWNVQVELKSGVNQIEVHYIKGRGANSYSPVYLFDPLGKPLGDLQMPGSENDLRDLVAAFEKANGLSDTGIRISAVPNQLAFSPAEIRIHAGKKVKLTFENPDLQIHNLVIIRPGSADKVGQLADQMAQDPDALARHYVPDSEQVIWSTPLINGKGSVELDFNAPNEPGRYPFICTFPGHWRVMRGVMVVYD